MMLKEQDAFNKTDFSLETSLFICCEWTKLLCGMGMERAVSMTTSLFIAAWCTADDVQIWSTRYATSMGEALTRSFVSQWPHDRAQDRYSGSSTPAIQWRSAKRVADRNQLQEVVREFEVENVYTTDAAPQWLGRAQTPDRKHGGRSARQPPQGYFGGVAEHYGNSHASVEQIEPCSSDALSGGYLSDNAVKKHSTTRVRPHSASTTQRPASRDATAFACGPESRARPQSAKVQRPVADSAGGQKDLLPSAIRKGMKESKWTERMFRSPSFQQTNLIQLEQETYQLLQNIFKKERVKAQKVSQKTKAPVRNGAQRPTKASEARQKKKKPALPCGSGLQLARNRKLKHQDTPTMNDGTRQERQHTEPLPRGSSEQRDRSIVRSKTYQRGKHWKPPFNQSEVQESRHRNMKTPCIRSQATDNSSNPTNRGADLSRDRVLQEMGWLWDSEDETTVQRRKPKHGTSTRSCVDELSVGSKTVESWNEEHSRINSTCDSSLSRDSSSVVEQSAEPQHSKRGDSVEKSVGSTTPVLSAQIARKNEEMKSKCIENEANERVGQHTDSESHLDVQSQVRRSDSFNGNDATCLMDKCEEIRSSIVFDGAVGCSDDGVALLERLSEYPVLEAASKSYLPQETNEMYGDSAIHKGDPQDRDERSEDPHQAHDEQEWEADEIGQGSLGCREIDLEKSSDAECGVCEEIFEQELSHDGSQNDRGDASTAHARQESVEGDDVNDALADSNVNDDADVHSEEEMECDAITSVVQTIESESEVSLSQEASSTVELSETIDQEVDRSMVSHCADGVSSARIKIPDQNCLENHEEVLQIGGSRGVEASPCAEFNDGTGVLAAEVKGVLDRSPPQSSSEGSELTDERELICQVDRPPSLPDTPTDVENRLQEDNGVEVPALHETEVCSAPVEWSDRDDDRADQDEAHQQADTSKRTATSVSSTTCYCIDSRNVHTDSCKTLCAAVKDSLDERSCISPVKQVHCEAKGSSVADDYLGSFESEERHDETEPRRSSDVLVSDQQDTGANGGGEAVDAIEMDERHQVLAEATTAEDLNVCAGDPWDTAVMSSLSNQEVDPGETRRFVSDDAHVCMANGETAPKDQRIDPTSSSTIQEQSPPFKAAQRIQRQYRCFLQRQIITDQLRFLLSQHHRQTRKNTQRVSKETASLVLSRSITSAATASEALPAAILVQSPSTEQLLPIAESNENRASGCSPAHELQLHVVVATEEPPGVESKEVHQDAGTPRTCSPLSHAGSVRQEENEAAGATTDTLEDEVALFAAPGEVFSATQTEETTQTKVAPLESDAVVSDADALERESACLQGNHRPEPSPIVSDRVRESTDEMVVASVDPVKSRTSILLAALAFEDNEVLDFESESMGNGLEVCVDESQSSSVFVMEEPSRARAASAALAALAFDDEEGGFSRRSAQLSSDYQTEDHYAFEPHLQSTQEEDATSDAAGSSAASDRWERYLDASTNKSYYYNPSTQVSQWTLPDNATVIDNAMEGETGTVDRWSLRRNHSQSAEKRGQWQAFIDAESNQPFYYNASTGESVWETPAVFQDQSSGDAGRTDGKSERNCQWVMYVDDVSGAAYYVNLETDETSWERPDDFASATVAGTSVQLQLQEEEDEYVIRIDEQSSELLFDGF